MKKEIIFSSGFDTFEDIRPVPAKTMIPEWYKDTRPYLNMHGLHINELGFTDNLSVKKCIPFLDVMTSGYLIKTYSDIEVTIEQNEPFYKWAVGPKDGPAIGWHATEQIPNYPNKSFNPNIKVAKFKNIWAVKTPNGYSSLFIPPAHHDNKMVIIPGIVDTDSYDLPVEFPFFLSDPEFVGIIPKGTPIAQVIPFKRDSWISDFKIENHEANFKRLKSVFSDGYKKMFWTRKSYE